jgi:hypothetical protein
VLQIRNQDVQGNWGFKQPIQQNSTISVIAVWNDGIHANNELIYTSLEAKQTGKTTDRVMVRSIQ